MSKSTPSKSNRANRLKRETEALSRRGLRLTRYSHDETWVAFQDRRITAAVLRRNGSTYGNTPRMMVELIDDNDICGHHDEDEACEACVMWEFNGAAYDFYGKDLDDPEITVR